MIKAPGRAWITHPNRPNGETLMSNLPSQPDQPPDASLPDLIRVIGELGAKVGQLAAQVEEASKTGAFTALMYECAIAEGRRREAEERARPRGSRPHRANTGHLRAVGTP